jgi:hypothetical protein
MWSEIYGPDDCEDGRCVVFRLAGCTTVCCFGCDRVLRLVAKADRLRRIWNTIDRDLGLVLDVIEDSERLKAAIAVLDEVDCGGENR